VFRRQISGFRTPEVRVPGLGEDAGPHPASRVAIGLALGLGVGLLSAFLLSREDKPEIEPADPRSLLPPP
jgi:hypothetical protein